MIEHEIIKLQIVSTVKLTVASYLLFFWVPKRVFPQEYIDNSLDRVMFNIIHMVALITLLFPFFVYIKIFGFIFLIIFFIALKLLFLKFYYRKNLHEHARKLYVNFILETLRILENPGSHLRGLKERFSLKIRDRYSRMRFFNLLYISTFVAIASYGLYLRTYRGYLSLVGAEPDMYQFYYWENILKKNILFDKIAGAPYMWSGPLLVHTTNNLANLNTVVLYNIFPILFLSFMFFTIFYVLRRLFEIDGHKTASVFLGMLLFAVVLPSPLAHKFFGLVIGTTDPELIRLFNLSIYYPPINASEMHNIISYPIAFFWRFTTTLPYEIASSFFLINLFFLMKFLETKRNLYILLYAESLGIVFAIHGGVAIPLFSSSVFLFLYSVVTMEINIRSLFKLTIAVFVATLVGNMWLLQFLFFKPSVGIGAAAPILDKFFYTGKVEQIPTVNVFSILYPPPLLLLLITAACVFLLIGIFLKRLRYRLAFAALVSLGVLFVYFAPNLGLPRIVDHSRLMVFVAYSYALVFSGFYYLFVEKMLFARFFKHAFFQISLLFVFGISVFAMAVTPRWIDSKLFWDNIYHIEYNEFPYMALTIEDKFQPFTYTVVSYVQQFPQVNLKGYHMNTQDLLRKYDPAEKKLDIPTEYIFIFMENYPKDYQGLGEYWYRWRRDIMLKLKDWIAIYSQTHDNMRLWYSSRGVDVYFIDNRTPEGSLLRQRESMRETSR